MTADNFFGFIKLRDYENKSLPMDAAVHIGLRFTGLLIKSGNCILLSF